MKSKPLKNWTPDERILAVKTIFNTITPQYDLLNRIMSGRRDVAWRKFAARRLPPNVNKVLDLATGTGDLAIAIAEEFPKAKVTGGDFVEKMMRLAENKTQVRGLGARIQFVAADATCLPFRDAEFEAVTIAFGLRNIPDRLGALREMKRVVGPGGKVITLEMTFPSNLRLRKFFRWYLNHMIPIVGGIISGNREAYTYLPDSIQDFLTPDQLGDLFDRAGFKDIKKFPLTFGLTYLHEGIAQ
ncbi:MAG: bifunctional demethylmenaquinone methyltransferase/2-methoxy-6-polyprenyl-1,4-benzoquinol methylase UbiE [Pseudomonadota bacterium]